MKFLFIATVIFLSSVVACKIIKQIEECPFCSIDGIRNPKCVCSKSKRVQRLFSCGVTCGVLAYCCESIKCPLCIPGEAPSRDYNCFCAGTVTPRLSIFKCGLFCSAIGFCCNAEINVC